VKDEMRTTLQQLIYNNSIRRTHTDVGMQLPPIWLKEVLVEGKTIDIEKAMEAYPNLEQAIIDALETGNIDALGADYIAVVRRLVGKAKAVAYAEMLKLELDGGAGKRVVFCWHTEPLLHVRNYLKKYGYDAVAVYGSTPEHERQEAVHRFMHDPDCKVFVGNIKVAGTGLTLTESSEIDMLESDWSPAGNAQAIKRVHRYGQTNEVHARFITLANSIDVAVNRIVSQKTASIAEIEGHSMTAAPLDVHA
jgi:SNF2 family DNA or RNA helicase